MLANGQKTTAAGIPVESVASYDAYITLSPLHAKGDGNGYVITLGGKRVFLAGVTECAPEIQALKSIDIAFIPVNLLVGRMTPAKAADCARMLRPSVVTRITSTTRAPGLWRIQQPRMLQKLRVLRTRQAYGV